MSTVVVSDALKLNQFPSDYELKHPVNKEREKEKARVDNTHFLLFVSSFFTVGRLP